MRDLGCTAGSRPGAIGETPPPLPLSARGYGLAANAWRMARASSAVTAGAALPRHCGYRSSPPPPARRLVSSRTLASPPRSVPYGDRARPPGTTCSRRSGLPAGTSGAALQGRQQPSNPLPSLCDTRNTRRRRSPRRPASPDHSRHRLSVTVLPLADPANTLPPRADLRLSNARSIADLVRHRA